MDYHLDTVEKTDEGFVEEIILEQGLFRHHELAWRKLREFLRGALESSKRGVSEFVLVVNFWGLPRLLVRRIMEGFLSHDDELSGLEYRLVSVKDILSNINRKLGEDRSITLALIDYFKELVHTSNKPLFVFVDDLEDLLFNEGPKDTGANFVAGLTEFLRCIVDGTEYACIGIRGRIHFVFIVTSTAYQEFYDVLMNSFLSERLVRGNIIHLRLKPILRTEFFRLMERLLDKIIKNKPDTPLRDRRLLEHVYTLARGNLSTIILQLRKYLSGFRGKTPTAEEFLSKLKSEALLDLEQRLASTLSSLPGAGGDPTPLLIILASAIYQDEPQFKELVSSANALRERYPIKISEGRAYIFESLEELEGVLSELANFAVSTGDPDIVYDLEVVLSSLTHWHPRGYAFVLPKTIDDIKFFIRQMNLNIREDLLENVIKHAEIILGRESREFTIAIYVSPTSYPQLFNAYREVSIPFIASDIAPSIYSNVLEILAHDPPRFSELAANAFIDALKQLFKLEVEDREYCILIPEDKTLDSNTYYRVPLKIRVVTGDPRFIIDSILKECNELRMCIIIAPRGITVPKNVWNIIVLGLSQEDLHFLAAKGYIDVNPRYKEHFIPEKWNEFVDSLAKNHNIREKVRSWLSDGVKYGVVLQPRLKGLHALKIEGAKGDAVFFNRYKLFLACGNNFNREQLLDLLIKLYNSWPLGKTTWCDIPMIIPPLENLETLSTYHTSENRFRETMNSIIAPTLRLAEMNMMVNESRDGRISLELHPVERRILEILNRSGGKVDRDRLKSFFILPSRAGKGETKVLDNLIEVLADRGLIEIGSDRTLKLVKNPLSREIEIEDLYRKFNDSVRKLIEALDKIGVPPKLRNARNALLHILVAREKWWKLIQLQDVIDAVEALRERYLDCRAPSTLIALDKFLKLASKVLEFIEGAIYEMHAIITNTDETLSEINRIRNEIRNKLKAIFSAEVDLPGSIIEPIESKIRKLSLRIHEYPKIITRDKLLSVIDSKLGRKPSEAPWIWEKFMFDKGCHSDSKFNIVLHIMHDMYEEFRRESKEYKDKLLELADLLSSIEAKSKHVPSELSAEFVKYLQQAASLNDIASCLKRISKKLDYEMKKLEELSRLKEERKRIQRSIEEALQQIIAIRGTLEDYRSVLTGLDIPRSYIDRLEGIISEANSIETLLRSSLSSLLRSQVSRELIDSIRDKLAQAFDGMYALESSTSSINRAVKEELRNRYIEPLSRQISVFQSQIDDMEILNQILALIKDLECLKNKLDGMEMAGLRDLIPELSDIGSRWQRIRQKCIEYLSEAKNISQKHVEALELLLGQTPERDFALRELIEKLSNKLNISEREALEILLELEEKELIRTTMKVKGYK